MLIIISQTRQRSKKSESKNNADHTENQKRESYADYPRWDRGTKRSESEKKVKV